MSFTESSHTDAKNRTNKIMTFGTFDLFHPGHVYYLSQAEMLGSTLIVVIARDTRVTARKGQSPKHDELRRKSNVEHAFPHATVILGDETDIFVPIRGYHPDILAFGYDQRVPESEICEQFPTTEIVRISSYEPEKWKTSLLREQYTEN